MKSPLSEDGDETEWRKPFKKRLEDASTEAKALVRLQVQDFAAWLKKKAVP